MTIKEFLGTLPDILLNEYTEYELKTWLLQGLSLLSGTSTSERITYLQLENGKVKLPSDFKKVYGVFFITRPPETNECKVIDTTPETIEEDTCKIEIYMKLVLDSPYFLDAYIPLKYVGDLSFLCTACPNINKCTEEFTIKNNYIYSSINEGTICLHYEAPLCNEKGETILSESQVVNEFLYKYLYKRIYEVKMLQKEEGSERLYQNYKQETDILYRKAKGETNMKNLNVQSLSVVAFGGYLNLLNRYNNEHFG